MDGANLTNKIPFFNRLDIRLLATLTLVALISVAGLGVTAFQSERSALKTQLIQQLTSVADLKEEEIDLWLKERRADVQMLAANRLNQDHVTAVLDSDTSDAEKTRLTIFLNDNLASMQQSRRGYTEIIIVGLDGTLIAASDSNLVGTNTIHSVALQGTLASPSGTYIQDIHLDPRTDHIEMAFGHIIHAVNLETGVEQSDIIGVVIIVVDMEETIYSLISAWPGLGDTGETLLIRAEGDTTLFLNNLRSDDDAALSLRVSTDSPNAIPAHNASRGIEGVIETPDYRGVPVVAAYRHIEGIGWGLVAKKNLDEMFDPVKALAYRTLFLAAMVLFAAGLVSVVMSHTLTRTLNMLVGVVNQVAGGNLTTKIEVRRRDEIGVLANAFRMMVTSLKERQRQGEAASQILHHLNATPDVTESFPRILETLQNITGSDITSLMIGDIENEAFELIAIDKPLPGYTKGMSIKKKDTAVTEDIINGRWHIANDLTAEQSFPLERGLHEHGYRCRVSVPLSPGGEIIGALSLTWKNREGFDQTLMSWLERIASSIALAVERGRLFVEINQRVEKRTRELAQAYEQLQELDKLKSKFVSDVSHELRSPVTNLKLYLSLLDRSPVGEKREKYLSVLQYQANRLEQLINDILDLSRLEQENGAKKFMPININELLERVKTVHSPRAEGIGLAFTVDLEPDLPLVWGARNQLIQVVTNLVANAINYTPAGSIQVSSSHDTENGRVYIKVSDTGMGIHPDDVPHLFERFYRGKASIAQDIPGTGLGLGIAREIVEAHGGEIDVESKVGIGSTFWVWLPAAEKNEKRK